MIFNIQRYSLHDGQGIRTLVFYKGCPLRCQWCSNPESQEFGVEVMHDPKRCKGFGDCITAVPGAITRLNGQEVSIRRDLIDNPEMLRQVCISKALTLSGQPYSTDEILDEIIKDFPFYREQGGVTLSGGEPLAQGNELTSLLLALKQRKISVNVETSLHVKWSDIARCLGLVGTFLVDLKHIDSAKFRTFTRGDTKLVTENLVRLTESGEKVIVRIPVIPDFNHTLAEMEMIIDFASSLNGLKEVHFLPYHALGSEKYRMLGREYPYRIYSRVPETELYPYLEYARAKGLKTQTGG